MTDVTNTKKEQIHYDVLIVGAGPAGLSAAIKVAQLAKNQSLPLRIAVLEKGSEVGAHILSGAVLEPRALNELLPNWSTLKAPLNVPAKHDAFSFLTSKFSIPLPVPPQMKNTGNFIISLGQFCKWLAEQAQNLGVDIIPGYAAVAPAVDETGKILGVITNDSGLNRKGEKKSNYMPGIEIHAKYTLLAEGCRGSLTKIINEKFQLQKSADPQTYAIGIKELWEVDPKHHSPGSVFHSVGWPLDRKTYGGSFLYHLDKNIISIGFVIGLDYQNPYLDPYEEFQRFKQHPKILNLLKGGTRIAYGARALNEGGFQSIPKLSFPGGLIIGCAAGFLNVPKIKGIHTAMKSGMLAAEAVFETFKKTGLSLQDNEITDELTQYETALRQSWIGQELFLARNIRPGFNSGLLSGLINAAIDTYLFRGRSPWTLHHRRADNLSLKTVQQAKPLHYPKHDGVISFDKLTSVALTHLHHVEDQPCHLRLKDPTIPINYNLPLFDAPEQRYCPALVYEILQNAEKKPYLQINAGNCIECKTCDIKDPKQNITWVPPEGGSGPNYINM